MRVGIETVIKMSISTYIHHFIVSNVLTLVHCLHSLIILAINYLKSLVSQAGPKPGLIPPSCLSDPKYGVHKYIKVNNIKLHYVESGDASKPLMLFVHGFPEFWYSWRHQIVEFQKDYWCIAIDMRGYGDSERPDGVSSYKIDLLVEDIRDLIRQLGREKFIMVAHDWGGVVGFEYRDRYPDTLSGYVSLGSASGHSWYRAMWTNSEQFKKSQYVFLNRAPYIPEKLLQMNNLSIIEKIMLVPGKDSITHQDIECYKYWFGKQYMSPYLVTFTDLLCYVRDDIRFLMWSTAIISWNGRPHHEFWPIRTYAITPPLNYYRANFSYYLPEKPRSDRKLPMLAVLGNDPYLCHVNLEFLKEEYEHVETASIEGCGHFLQQEEPDRVNKLIREFLTKHKL